MIVFLLLDLILLFLSIKKDLSIVVLIIITSFIFYRLFVNYLYPNLKLNIILYIPLLYFYFFTFPKYATLSVKQDIEILDRKYISQIDILKNTSYDYLYNCYTNKSYLKRNFFKCFTVSFKKTGYSKDLKELIETNKAYCTNYVILKSSMLLNNKIPHYVVNIIPKDSEYGHVFIILEKKYLYNQNVSGYFILDNYYIYSYGENYTFDEITKKVCIKHFGKEKCKEYEYKIMKI